MNTRIAKFPFIVLLAALAIAAAQPPATQPATAPDSPRRVDAFVSGKVQGVGFRNFTQSHAQPLKLTGWVKNLPDGRVEMIVEGPSAAVDQLIDFVRKGPPGSRVDDVKITDQTPTGEFKSFDVVP